MEVRKSEGGSDGELSEQLGERKQEGMPKRGLNVSFKDKLLQVEGSSFSVDSRGCGVFEDAWREYLDNLKGFFDGESLDGENSGGRSEEEEDSLPTLTFSREQYERWCAPWRKSLIVRLLGKSMSLWNMQSRLLRLWKTKEKFTVRDIGNDCFVVSFLCEEDMEYVYLEGPWMLADHYLVVQRWQPNFDPLDENYHRKIAAWIRIPVLPLEFFNAESLHMIGNLVGKTLKVDSRTYLTERGKFARICVELDLDKKLWPAIRIFGKELIVEYEGLHKICFCCGKYGHCREVCSEKDLSMTSRVFDNNDEVKLSSLMEVVKNESIKGLGGHLNEVENHSERVYVEAGEGETHQLQRLGERNLVRKSTKKRRNVQPKDTKKKRSVSIVMDRAKIMGSVRNWRANDGENIPISQRRNNLKSDGNNGRLRESVIDLQMFDSSTTNPVKNAQGLNDKKEWVPRSYSERKEEWRHVYKRKLCSLSCKKLNSTSNSVVTNDMNETKNAFGVLMDLEEESNNEGERFILLSRNESLLSSSSNVDNILHAQVSGSLENVNGGCENHNLNSMIPQ